jgi:hypothetical protein
VTAECSVHTLLRAFRVAGMLRGTARLCSVNAALRLPRLTGYYRLFEGLVFVGSSVKGLIRLSFGLPP